MPATRPATAASSDKVSSNKKWAEMNANDRFVFVAKVCIMVCTGGFVFANILADDIPPTDSAG